MSLDTIKHHLKTYFFLQNIDDKLYQVHQRFFFQYVPHKFTLYLLTSLLTYCIFEKTVLLSSLVMTLVAVDA